MLFEFINNWIDLVPMHEEVFKQAIHSLSGIILLHSWKLTNWITCEILCGKYFEAIRSLRFIFEGTVYAVIIEDAIESRVSEKRGGLSEVGLKKRFLSYGKCVKGKRVYEKRRINVNKIKRIVASFVNQRMDPSKTKEAEEYIEVYTEILSDKRLYLSTSKMIEESARILKIEENDVRELKIVA